MVALLMAGKAQATLFDRGNGLIYDDVLNITWTQNANLCEALSNCIPGPGGSMTWYNANLWAANLVFDGFSDWRLATISSTSPTLTPTDCSTATAAACAASGNELGYMYYYNMDGGGNNTGTQTVNGINLINVQSGYWSGTEFNTAGAWVFAFSSGGQGGVNRDEIRAAWAVRPGDSVGYPSRDR